MSSPDRCLPKAEIIRRNVDFRNVIQNGKRWRGEWLKFFFERAERRLIGFAVPKRLGIAVLRNRTKRLMREVYRKHRWKIGDYRIVILAKTGARRVGFHELEKDFKQFLYEIGASWMIFKRLILTVLKYYKRWVSPVLPQACRFYPTCSDYTRQAVIKHGISKGLFFGLKRLLRCHPLSSGGYDPVP